MAPALPFCPLQRSKGGAGTAEKVFLPLVWDQLLSQYSPFCMITAALSSCSTHFASCSWCQYLKKSRDFLWSWKWKMQWETLSKLLSIILGRAHSYDHRILSEENQVTVHMCKILGFPFPTVVIHTYPQIQPFSSVLCSIFKQLKETIK